MKCIDLKTPGGPTALTLVDAPDPVAEEGLVVVELKAIGVNFIDTYQRSGLYPLSRLENAPTVIGQEGAGVVREVGAGVTGFQVGDRVCYAGVLGSYAELHAVPARALVKIPERVSFEEAAALMLQGLTAHYLVRGAALIKHGDSAVVHSGAGGVGALLTQMIKYHGGYVYSVVSTDEKAIIAEESGADCVIVSKRSDFQHVILERSGGEGVDVVFDSVGRDTFDRSLEVLKPRGTLVSFGQSSGPVPPFDLMRLRPKSLFLTRPQLSDYIATREQLTQRAQMMFELLLTARIQLRIHARFSLKEASDAHRLLESRGSTGKILLLPG